jgi:hypothetical protein
MTTQERLETAKQRLKEAIAEGNRIMISYWKCIIEQCYKQQRIQISADWMPISEPLGRASNRS